jgi:hypothetical protein
MSTLTHVDDGLDTRFEMTDAVPRRPAVVVSFRTIARGALYGLLLLVAFAIGTLAMVPGESPLADWLSPRASAKCGSAGSCCIQLDIPSDTSPALESEAAPANDHVGRLAAE